MKKIIALRGIGKSGKTTTINLLQDILTNNGYNPVPGKYQSYGDDFLDIYKKAGSLVGITSSGDTFDLVKARLDELVKENCDVCVCACRTCDRKPPGTNAATKLYPSYTTQYLDKTYTPDSTTQAKVNASDANILFSMI